MLIEFSISNYRSIKEEQFFSMLADSGKSKPGNFFYPEGYEDKLKLLKTAVLFGPNASGKTNIILGLYNMRKFILDSTDLKSYEDIKWYEPFRMASSMNGAPSSFRIEFIGKDHKKYIYEVKYNLTEIILESLDFYPGARKANLFKRSGNKVEKLGEYFPSKAKVSKTIPKNILLLSREGNSGREDLLYEIYSYFVQYRVGNALDKSLLFAQQRDILKLIVKGKDSKLKTRLERLIRSADTRIESLSYKDWEPVVSGIYKDPQGREWTRTSKEPMPAMTHKVYDKNRKEVGTVDIDFDNESSGTQVLFGLGGYILKKLDEGGVLIYDEMDNSLHPKLIRFLVSLFHSPIANPKNTQLIFATHETTLLDHELFRKDQLWFTEKNKYGETALYSTQDFEGIRDDQPFAQWYMRGKFGAQPNIKEIDFIYGKE